MAEIEYQQNLVDRGVVDGDISKAIPCNINICNGDNNARCSSSCMQPIFSLPSLAEKETMGAKEIWETRKQLGVSFDGHDDLKHAPERIIKQNEGKGETLFYKRKENPNESSEDVIHGPIATCAGDNNKTKRRESRDIVLQTKRTPPEGELRGSNPQTNSIASPKSTTNNLQVENNVLVHILWSKTRIVKDAPPFEPNMPSWSMMSVDVAR
ncbi:hypothetical protein Fmac_018901 [Flemingia macrophylla]|uniref:Uncharacterized protein n=1 Tax=Flemingia macrophylla TaxID=520843 RepID=A0ABD1M693_9FABA